MSRDLPNPAPAGADVERRLNKAVLRLVKGGPERRAIAAGEVDAIVDPVDGAMYKLTPKELNAVMQASGTPEPAAASAPAVPSAARVVTEKGDRVYIAVTLHPDPSWERIGTLQRLPAPPAAN